MNMIAILARSRVRHNRSTTALTAIALTLTTCLLMGVGTIATGLMRVNRIVAGDSYGNHHASFANVTDEGVDILRNHIQIEALSTSELLASVVKDKMEAFIGYGEDLLPGISGTKLTEGRLPEAEDEIAGPPAFFTRLGYPDIAVGDTVEVSLRIHGEGEVITLPFRVTGLFAQRDISHLDIADTRIVYSATTSEAFAERYMEGLERRYTVRARVRGEADLNYDQMKQRLIDAAADAGVPESAVSVNSAYLMWMTDPGTETMTAIAGISALIVLFASVIIYSIYYVSILTNVQELGKLRALGATKRQMRSLLLREGLTLALFCIPAGLVLGYLLARLAMWILLNIMSIDMALLSTPLLSLPIILFTVAVVLLTVVLSLLRPMRMAARISPMEALRYQEKGAGDKARRSGREQVSLRGLSAANLGRNRRRTAVTILSMGMGGILFMGASGLLASLNEMDYVRQHLKKGDFQLELLYSSNDDAYPENNLDSLQTTDILGEEMRRQIAAIPGVTAVEPYHRALAYVDYPGYEAGKRVVVEGVSRADVAAMAKDLQRGSLDYDAMLKENGIIFPWDSSFEDQGFTIGDKIPLTFCDGERRVEFTATLMASTYGGRGEFQMPLELLEGLITESNPAAGLYIHADEERYTEVKQALEEIVGPNLFFALVSIDEELAIAGDSMDMMRYAAYLLLAILGLIALMNLINTMVTSIVTRRREIGMLQAVGMSGRQLRTMLSWEGLVFTAGTLLCALSLGNLIGYGLSGWAIENRLMGITSYHYPLAQTLILLAVLLVSQVVISLLISRQVQKDSLVSRLQQ